jgi:sporulation protein YlmC with PRC-barrel domain
MLHKLLMTTALTGLLIGAAAAQSTSTAPANGASGAASVITMQSGNQWLSSNLVGVDVIGADNEKIGDVSDILFDRSGSVVGYVVGVGGFLGIGTKNVALAPSAFQVMPASADSGTTGSASTTNEDNIKLKLNMTKDQLKQAAAFESRREQDSKARASTPKSDMNRPASPPATAR